MRTTVAEINATQLGMGSRNWNSLPSFFHAMP